jgi:hypothetical protein
MSDSPLFVREEKDPYELRFRVRPTVWLPVEEALPIYLNEIWNALSFTKALEPGKGSGWTSMVRGQPVQLKERDGQLLAELLQKQAMHRAMFPLRDHELFDSGTRVKGLRHPS